MTTVHVHAGGTLAVADVYRYRDLAGQISRTSSGLIYEDDFTTLSGWTNGGIWSSVTAPRFVCFGKLPTTILGPTATGTAEDDGVREPQLYIENDAWYLLYDAGDGSTGWRQFVASSTDRGRTWTRHGAVDAGLSDGSGGNYAAVATGWLEKRGGVYYLHRVTAASTFVSPNVGLPAGPYGWDTWQAPSPLGPWTFVNKTPAPAGTWASGDYLPGSVVKINDTYHAFIQGAAPGAHYTVGVATSSSPTGPWALQGDNFWSQSRFGGRDPENIKVFWHPGIERWVALLNMIATAGTYTDRNMVAVSTSPSDWSTASTEYTQGIGPIDGSGNAIGLAAHFTGPDGELIYDADTGNVPIVYDASPQRYSPGWHLGRSIHGAVLEPSPAKALYNDAGQVNINITRSLAHGDFEGEFVVKFNNDTINTNVGFWFRQDGSGNGYRLVVRNNEPLLLQKVVAGSLSLVVNASGNNGGGGGSDTRIRVRVVGSSIKAWMNGQLQVDTTDTSHASGTHIAFSGFAANAEVRKLSIRTATTDVTLGGVTPGSEVVLRSWGGLPVATATANGSGVATFAGLTHGPHTGFEVGGTDHNPDGGIWPGDAYTLS